MAIDDGIQLAEQIVQGVRTRQQIAADIERELIRRRRRRRLGGVQSNTLSLGASCTPVASPGQFQETGAGFVLSNGNRTATSDGLGADRSAHGGALISSGRVYVEMQVNPFQANDEIGCAPSSAGLNSLMSLTANAICLRSDGAVFSNLVNVGTSLTWGQDDVVSVILDHEDDTIQWAVNGELTEEFALPSTVALRFGYSTQNDAANAVTCDGGQDLTYEPPAPHTCGWTNV